MDYSKLTPMMKQYMEVKEKYPECILFYRLGDFYEMFFDDAITASRVLEIALTSRNAGLEKKASMCGIPFHSADAYIKKLINSGYKVAICEQLEDPTATKGIVKRDVIKVITPGAYENVDNNDYNYIMFIDSQHANYYYISLCDLTTGKLKALTIIKDNNKLFNEIRNYNIKEIVVTEGFDTTIFNSLLKSYKLVISIIKLDVSSENKIIKTIDNEYKSGFNYLIGYIEQLQMNALDYFMEVEYQKNTNMSLDFTTIYNLELCTTIKNNDKYGTLYWYLDKTKTAMGSRLLKEYVSNPLLDVQDITKRQLFIDGLIDNYLTSETISSLLKSVYDIARISAKIGLRTVNPKDLLWLEQSLDTALQIKDELASIDNQCIQNFYTELDLVNELKVIINQSIDNNILLGSNEYIIKRGYNTELDEYHSLLENSTSWLVDFEQRQREITGIKNLKVKYNKVFGYYIEISNGNKHLVKEEFNYTRKQTLVNAERYINSELKEQESKILSAQDNFFKLENQLFNEIKDIIYPFIKRLQDLGNKLAYIDVMQSFSVISRQHGFSKPIFNDNKVIDIKDSFHPIVKVLADEKSFINNDFQLDDMTNTLIITGPNMGGKSTYMRQLALIVIMAQVGCYVPASKANIMLFDNIYTRIGASDDLVSGQSTFMVEMLEASNAILNATSNSLILFDEIGRGTATYDGMSLAHSIIEYLSLNNQAKLLFSTHYHELVNLQEKHPNIKNYHAGVIDKEDKITFTYKVIPGSVDKSYGIHVAKLANLPQVIIERSYQLLDEYENHDHSNTNSRIQYVEVKSNENEDIINDITKLDLNSLKPIEALLILEQLQAKIGSK